MTAENNVVLALYTEISELETTKGSMVGSSQEVKAREVEIERDLGMAHEAVEVSDFHQKTLMDKDSSLTEKLSLYV